MSKRTILGDNTTRDCSESCNYMRQIGIRASHCVVTRELEKYALCSLFVHCVGLSTLEIVLLAHASR